MSDLWRPASEVPWQRRHVPIGYALLYAATLSLFAAATVAGIEARFHAYAEPAVAEILSARLTRKGTWATTLAITTSDGYRFTGRAILTKRPPPDGRLPVLYRRDSPGDFRIGDGREGRLAARILGVFGLLFLVVAGTILAISRAYLRRRTGHP